MAMTAAQVEAEKARKAAAGIPLAGGGSGSKPASTDAYNRAQGSTTPAATAPAKSSGGSTYYNADGTLKNNTVTSQAATTPVQTTGTGSTSQIGSNDFVKNPVAAGTPGATQLGDGTWVNSTTPTAQANQAAGVPTNQDGSPLTGKSGGSLDTKGIFDSLAGARDAQIAAANAGVDKALAQQLADLQKAYNDAIMNGELSTREAEAQYQEQKKAVEAQAYQDAQVTNLAGEDRGIGNSQQMAGLMQGDQARSQGLLNTNMTQRDKQIADIKTRLDAIKLNKDLDVATANSVAGYSKVENTANAYSQYNNNMFGFQSQDYFAQQQQGFNQQNMAQQQGYTQQNMAQQQGYNQQNAATQQGYNQQNMATQHGYNKDTMKTQQGYDLAKMKVGNDYDIEKMGISFEQDLAKMQKQFGYDMSKLSSQQKAQAALAAQDFNNKVAIEQQQYVTARDREMAKYQPGTQEYNIRLNQLQDEHDSRMSGIYDSTVFDATIKSVLTDPSITDKDGNVVKPRMPTQDEMSGMTSGQILERQRQLDAYQRYENLISGKSNAGNYTSNYNGAPFINPANAQGSAPKASSGNTGVNGGSTYTYGGKTYTLPKP